MRGLVEKITTIRLCTMMSNERSRPLLPRPACGERVGVRGTLNRLGLAESPPHPALRADLSPQAGRGEGKLTDRPSQTSSIASSHPSPGIPVQRAEHLPSLPCPAPPQPADRSGEIPRCRRRYAAHRRASEEHTPSIVRAFRPREPPRPPPAVQSVR